jgi:rRNA maturation RNase YbeY
MINLRMTPRSITFDSQAFTRDAQTLLNTLDYTDYDLGIWLTTNTTIRRYNRMYRSKDKATDILSFAYHAELKAGERIMPQSPEDKNLGDLLISLEYVQRDAPRWGQSFEQRMQVLLVHGICHLLGYDHMADSDYQIMKRKETALLKKLI